MRTDYTILEATFRIVTPMFCGGADHGAELRLPSIKGALRFWWRTLQWAPGKKASELAKKEAELFGSSDQSHGRSKVQIQFLGPPALDKVIEEKKVLANGSNYGAHYLGYGVMEAFPSKANPDARPPKAEKKAGELNRSMIPGGWFSIRLRCGPNLSSEYFEGLKNALILLGTVGGIGSKSRKGYGSLTLTELTCNGTMELLPEDPGERLKSILRNLPSGVPEWTAWSSAAVVVQSEVGQDSLKLLDLLGREFVHFRSWGLNGKVLWKDSEQNFKDDHDLSKEPNDKAFPQRAVFGLPHNYGKFESKSVRPAKLERRASPLFFHVHRMSDASKPKALVVFLPARFLPQEEDLLSFGKLVKLREGEPSWKPIEDFLDRLLERPGVKPLQDNSLKSKEVKLG